MNWEQLICAKRDYESEENINNETYQSEFEKDYRSIIHSPIFRRLQDKTQAFPLDDNDFIRTRLTHSLEVSSVGNSLGESIFMRLKHENKDKYFEENSPKVFCDILMCAGLIHDIGNPPFGHFGEYAIRNWFEKNLKNFYYKGEKITDILTEQMLLDLYNFEGNAQAIRILSKSQHLGENKGLNLTYAVLNSIIKYPISSKDIMKDSTDIKYGKMGFNYSEEELFHRITKATGAYENRHPITYILEASDDIAYKIADIEDAIVKRIITYEQLVNNFYRYRNDNMSDEHEKVFYKMVDDLEKSYKISVKNQHKNPDLNAVQRWGVGVQNTLIKSATEGFSKNYDEIMAGVYKKDLFNNTDAENIIYVLSNLANEYIFKDRAKAKIELAGRKIIQNLLDTFVEAAIYFDENEETSIINKKTMNIFSNYYKSMYHKDKVGKNESERLYLRLFMIVDYISSMTDSHAQKLYQELNGIKF